MSLIDDARLRIANAVNSRWSRAEIVSEVLAALTAAGPVIFLPDTGEGVRFATWAEVLRYSEEYRRLQVSDVLEIAGEVAE